MLQLIRHKLFKKDIVKVTLTDQQFSKMIRYLSELAEENELPIEANDHPLNGEWKTFREFHLGGDSQTWTRKSSFHCDNFEEIDHLPNADVFMMFNIFPYIKTPNIFIEGLRSKLNSHGILAIRQYDGAALRFGPIDHKKRLIIDNALYSGVGSSEQFRHYDMDRIFELINMSSFVKKNTDFELYKRMSPFDQNFINYYKNTIEWTMRHVSENAKQILDDWYQQYVLNHKKNDAYFFEVDLTAILSD